MDHIELRDKVGLVLGVANERSIAWAIAQCLDRAGARVALTYQNERVRPHVERLAAELRDPLVALCDVTADGEIEALFARIGREWERLDFLVHSIAFAPAAELGGEFLRTSRAGFHETLDVSAYSLIPLARGAVPFMGAGGGAVIAITFQASQRVFPGYNVMGTAKAALEQIVRQLAYELGSHAIRVCGLSAGPLRTLAARGIPGFPEMAKSHAERAPLKRSITHDEVARAALFLVSDLASGITGEVLHVDAGYHIMGV
ncbi:MAG: enoyl-ACP reductase [Candidatus Bipolaricaulota bacterium]